MAANYLLYETATGHALFDVVEAEDIGSNLDKVQESILDLKRFGKMVKLKAFVPFKSAEEALTNINDVSEGICSETMSNFLEMNLPKSKSARKCPYTLGVSDPKLGTGIQEALNIKCSAKEAVTTELLRGVRMHFTAMMKDLTEKDMARAQLGLAHSYSRAKVKFNVHKSDNMIIQAIALVDQLDKDINTFAMRAREWYSWHFPELVKVCTDNIMFARCAYFIGKRTTLSAEKLPELEAITMDSTMAQSILDAAKMSMGFDISDIDMLNITMFTEKVVHLADYRKKLHEYLQAKMEAVAPNLAALIGDIVGARLISHAGSLTNLAKYPASTVQILGAEKALFRALKTKGNTPKYGLIFHSSFIGRAQQKNKGRISRYLANKCSIASRIDCFSEEDVGSVFGEKLRDQVEERLKFYETGDAPRKNIDVMREAIKEIGGDADASGEKKAKKAKKEKKEKKRKAEEAEEEDDEVKPKKRKKKSAEGEDDGKKKIKKTKEK
jgi:nucleolar protein 56